MANKSDRFYYQNFIDATDYACKAAEYLAQCLSNYEPSNIKTMLETMHQLEHLADQKRHEMSVTLAKSFMTPFDREDLVVLSQNIDEVIDTIEEILQRFYINNIQFVRPESLEFAYKICNCCELMKEMLTELEHFKKPERLHALIVDLNHAEEACDGYYLDVTATLHRQRGDILDIIAWREIYDYFENCADACENVADCIETIVMKNT